jgi:hypothetical protein
MLSAEDEAVFLLHSLQSLACAQGGQLAAVILEELFHAGCASHRVESASTLAR